MTLPTRKLCGIAKNSRSSVQRQEPSLPSANCMSTGLLATVMTAFLATKSGPTVSAALYWSAAATLLMKSATSERHLLGVAAGFGEPVAELLCLFVAAVFALAAALVELIPVRLVVEI